MGSITDGQGGKEWSGLKHEVQRGKTDGRGKAREGDQNLK